MENKNFLEYQLHNKMTQTIINLKFIFRKTSDSFNVYVTLDIASDHQISINGLRDMILKNIHDLSKLGTHTVNDQDFIFHNIEGMRFIS